MSPTGHRSWGRSWWPWLALLLLLRLSDLHRPGGAGVELHLVELVNVALDLHGSGRLVLHVDDLAQHLHGSLVAGLGRQLHGPAQLHRGRFDVARRPTLHAP